MYTLMQIIVLISGFIIYFFGDPNEQNIPVVDFTRKINIRVLFKNNNIKNILKELQSRRSANPSAFDSRDEKESEFYKTLKAYADETQKKTIDALKDHLSQRDAKENKITFKQMWTLNQLFVWNADSDVIKTLAKMEDVSDIQEEQEILNLPHQDPNEMSRQPEPEPEPENQKKSIRWMFRHPINQTRTVRWNLLAIDVHKAWDKGFKGKGAVVGIIDTGVRATHEALVDNWRKDYGWFDPYDHTEKPFDPWGHGTFLIGTAVGSHDIGVAPEAQWIACRGMEAFTGGMHLDLCMEWMHCPTEWNGENMDCGKRPHIVIYSMGTRPGDFEIEDVQDKAIHSWVDHNIIGVFSSGNGGPGCSTVEAPGVDERVITVGASTQENTVWLGSAVGPAIINGTNRIKPDVVAPGMQIYSSGNNSDTDYFAAFGTSVAVPHVAGLAALYASRFPKGYANAFKKAIIKSTKPVSHPNPPRICGGISESRYPNNHAGYGLVNAVKLLQQLLKINYKCCQSSGSNSIFLSFYPIFIKLILVLQI